MEAVLSHRAKQRSEGLLSLATSFIVAVGLTAFALWPNWSAEFGPIDDHEPLRWMGADRELALGEILPILWQDTEMADFGSAARFRPSYYALRTVQAALFDMNVSAWYWSVALSFAVTCALLGFVVGWWVKLALGTRTTRCFTSAAIWVAASALGTLMFASLPAWAGIVTRLGPSELLAILGLAVVALSVTALMRGGRSRWWIALIAGTWVSVLAKETMLPLVAVGPIVAWALLGPQVHNRKFSFAVMFASILPAVIVLVAVVPPILNGSRSAYAPTGASESRVGQTLNALILYWGYWVPALAVLVTSVVLFMSTQYVTRRIRLGIAGLAGLTVIWFLYDMWIYSGTFEWPRYEITMQVMKVLWIFGALALAVAVYSSHSKAWKRSVALVTLVLALALGILALAATPRNLLLIRDAAELNSQATTQYKSQMQAVVDSLRANAVNRVAIVTPGEGFNEAVHAISQQIQLELGLGVEVTTLMQRQDLGDVQYHSTEHDFCVAINDEPGQVSECGAVQGLRVNVRVM
jgi:VanZ family protein